MTDKTKKLPKSNEPAKMTRGELVTASLTAFIAALNAGFYFATPGSARAINIISGIVMIGVIIVGAIIANRVWGRRGLIAISMVTVVALSAGAVGAAIVWQLKHDHDTNSAPSQIRPPSPTKALNFSAAPNTIVPYCSTYYGSGTIPKGDSLLIFDSPADSAGNVLEPKEYGFHDIAQPLPNGGWSVKDVKILQTGDSGKRAELFGVLETAQDAKFVKDITVSDGGYWRSGELPSGLGQITPLPVVRNGSLGC